MAQSSRPISVNKDDSTLPVLTCFDQKCFGVAQLMQQFFMRCGPKVQRGQFVHMQVEHGQIPLGRLFGRKRTGHWRLGRKVLHFGWSGRHHLLRLAITHNKLFNVVHLGEFPFLNVDVSARNTNHRPLPCLIYKSYLIAHLHRAKSSAQKKAPGTRPGACGYSFPIAVAY